MNITNIDQDTASIHLYKHKDNVNDTIYHLTNESPESINQITPTPSPPLRPLPTPSSTHDSVEAIFDSGASGHYVREEDEPFVTNIETCLGPIVTLPNAAKIQSTKKSLLPLSSKLTTKGQTGYILPDLKSSTLISTGQLCDDQCDVVFRENTVHVLQNKQAMDNFLSNQESILTGSRNRLHNLWTTTFPIVKTNLQSNNCILPPTHAALYCSKTNIPSPTKKLPYSKKAPQPSHSPFSSMESLIDDNAFDCALAQQVRLDRLTNVSTSSSYPFHDLHSIIDDNVLPQANVILRKDKTKSELADYFHACCLFPVLSTFITAIQRGHFSSWPGLTVDLVTKHLTKNIHTEQGHLRQEYKNLQSTDHKDKLRKIQANITRLKMMNPDVTSQDIIRSNSINDCLPSSPSPNQRSNSVIYNVFSTDPTGLGYTDLTGRFPYCSSRGNEYIFVGYHYDANAILAIAIPDRKSTTLVNAWKTLHEKFTAAGVAPDTYIQDNEISKDLKYCFSENDIKFQLVPPHNHRANAAERAIQTFKSHFIAGLSGLDPNFPIKQWDRLLEQSVLTLNLLRSARLNPKLSAHSFLFGEFNFTSTPLAPIGTRVIAHVKKDTRKSWDPRGESGWYVGPALEHHRCVTCYFPRTRALRVVDTVKFSHTQFHFLQPH